MKLATVPEKWKRDGLLKWPLKKVSLLVEHEDSSPEKHWRSIKCTTKGEFDTYMNSEEYIDRRTVLSDTENTFFLINKLSSIEIRAFYF